MRGEQGEASAAELGAWVQVHQAFSLVPDAGTPFPLDVVRELRLVDRRIAPLWCATTYRTPDKHLVTCGRWLLAVYVPDSKAPWTRVALHEHALHGVLRPCDPVPRVLRGLPGGPYLEDRLLEGLADGLKPGAFEPLTMEHVQMARAGVWAKEHNTTDELDRKRKELKKAAAAKRQAATRAARIARREPEAHALAKKLGWLPPQISVPHAYGT